LPDETRNNSSRASGWHWIVILVHANGHNPAPQVLAFVLHGSSVSEQEFPECRH